MKIEIKARFTDAVIISGDYESIRDCLEKNRGADLRDADLRGAKGYANSHDIFAEVIRRQRVELFSDAEWAAIAQITIHRLCWDSIQKRFNDIMPGIFKKLADAGFGEWLEYWNTLK